MFSNTGIIQPAALIINYKKMQTRPSLVYIKKDYTIHTFMVIYHVNDGS